VPVPTYRQADRVLADVLEGRAVLVNPAGTELFTLNPVGSVVWSALDGGADIGALVAAVVKACAPVDEQVVRADVEEFVDELSQLGLIVHD
jgi:hypothetical protein